MFKEAFHNALKRIYKFDKKVQLKEFEFGFQRAVFKGKITRTCATIYVESPCDERRWYSKICAVVILGFKLFSFSAYRGKD